jgi:hypothetical protein
MGSEADKHLLTALDERMRAIASEVFEERQSAGPVAAHTCADAEELYARLRRIMAKEFITIAEAALMLNCSDGHLRNLIDKAIKGKAVNPVPFLDLDGVRVFPRVKLLEWASQPKGKLKDAN